MILSSSFLLFLFCGALAQSENSSSTNTTLAPTNFNLTSNTNFSKGLNATLKKYNPKGEVALASEDRGQDGIEIEYETTPIQHSYSEEEEYEEQEQEEEEQEEEDKFMSKPNEITLEHIDFVQLRLRHIARSTSDNITELRIIQEKEFALNPLYNSSWLAATKLFNKSKRSSILSSLPNSSSILSLPPDYHIAIIAYTLSEPQMYTDFNKKTREICSGKEIDANYNYKSYFKLLLLALRSLGPEPKFKPGNRFLYRGVGSLFKLEVGQVLAFQHFVSTSASLKIAENFAGSTLFEMEGPFKGTSMSIKDHSFYEGEEEVLFSPLQVYRVDSKHEGKHYTRYVLKASDFKVEGPLCGFEPGCRDDKDEDKGVGEKQISRIHISSGAGVLRKSFWVGIFVTVLLLVL